MMEMIDAEPRAVPIDTTLRALADPTRRALLALVRDGERSAGDLAAQVPTMSRPAVSQHLRVLAEAGLVTVRAEGPRRLYRAQPEPVQSAAAVLDELWAGGLGRLKTAVEAEAGTRSAVSRGEHAAGRRAERAG